MPFSNKLETTILAQNFGVKAIVLIDGNVQSLEPIDTVLHSSLEGTCFKRQLRPCFMRISCFK
jgi:hypothetical protein